MDFRVRGDSFPRPPEPMLHALREPGEEGAHFRVRGVDRRGLAAFHFLDLRRAQANRVFGLLAARDNRIPAASSWHASGRRRACSMALSKSFVMA